MIAARDAVTAGVVQACRDGLIGVGRGTTLTSLQTRYCRQVASFDPNEDGVWIIPPFELEPIAPAGTSAARPGSAGHVHDGSASATHVAASTSVGSGGTGAVAPGDTTTCGEGTIRRFVIKGSVPTESWGDLFRSFVGPAARMELRKLRLGIDFQMDANPDTPLNADDPAMKAMREAARQLGLTFKIEE